MKNNEGNKDLLIKKLLETYSTSDIVAADQLASISAIITACRIERNMTQKEFAKFMGVTQGMVSKWESEDYNYSVKALAKICDKLNLNLEIRLTPQWGNAAEGYGELAVHETD